MGGPGVPALPASAERSAAIVAGLAAYERGDFFLAHEDLEPAWMGSSDVAERAVLQGLIKLAAAYVHAVRGNPRGVERNLDGARQRLLEPGAAEAAAGIDGLDVAGLVEDIDLRLAELRAASVGGASVESGGGRASATPAGAPRPTSGSDHRPCEGAPRDRRIARGPDHRCPGSRPASSRGPGRPLLVDVREPVEFAEVRAPGARPRTHFVIHGSSS